MPVITLFIASQLQLHFSLPFWRLQVFFLNQLEKYLSFVSRWRRKDTGEKSTFLDSGLLLFSSSSVPAAYKAARLFTSRDSSSTTPTEFPSPSGRCLTWHSSLPALVCGSSANFSTIQGQSCTFGNVACLTVRVRLSCKFCPFLKTTPSVLKRVTIAYISVFCIVLCS